MPKGDLASCVRCRSISHQFAASRPDNGVKTRGSAMPLRIIALCPGLIFRVFGLLLSGFLAMKDLGAKSRGQHILKLNRIFAAVGNRCFPGLCLASPLWIRTSRPSALKESSLHRLASARARGMSHPVVETPSHEVSLHHAEVSRYR